MKKLVVFIIATMLLVSLFAVNAGALTDKQKELMDYAKSKDIAVDVSAQFNQIENYCEAHPEQVITDEQATKIKALIDEIVIKMNELAAESNATKLEDLGKGNTEKLHNTYDVIIDIAETVDLTAELLIVTSSDGVTKTASVVIKDKNGNVVIDFSDIIKKTGATDYTVYFIAGIVILAAAAFVTTRKLRTSK